MKKFLFLICMMQWAVLPISALEPPEPQTDTLGAAVNKKVAQAVALSKQPWEKPLAVHFDVAESVFRLPPQPAAHLLNTAHPSLGLAGDGFLGSEAPSHPLYKALLSCPAYALDNHWLLLSKEGCLQDDTNPVLDDRDNRYYQHTGKKITSAFKLLGFSRFFIPSDNYATNHNVMLLWTGNIRAVHLLQSVPKVNLLAVSTPARLVSLSQEPVLIAQHNTAARTATVLPASLPTAPGLTPPRKSKAQTPEKGRNVAQKPREHTFQFNDSDLDNTPDATLFLKTPSGDAFVVGYSHQTSGYTLSRKGDDFLAIFHNTRPQGYFTLALEDLEFIKKTVLEKRPKDWERIKNRLFFDQTETPYFK